MRRTVRNGAQPWRRGISKVEAERESRKRRITNSTTVHHSEKMERNDVEREGLKEGGRQKGG